MLNQNGRGGWWGMGGRGGAENGDGVGGRGIQEDSRKFLDLFKSYSGSQISSQSLNEIHIY